MAAEAKLEAGIAARRKESALRARPAAGNLNPSVRVEARQHRGGGAAALDLEALPRGRQQGHRHGQGHRGGTLLSPQRLWGADRAPQPCKHLTSGTSAPCEEINEVTTTCAARVSTLAEARAFGGAAAQERQHKRAARRASSAMF